MKERILKEAQALFLQKGVKAVSMDDVAAHLSVSKKTIYKWFANKDELVYESMQLHVQDMETNCCHMLQESENALEGLFKIVEMVRELTHQIHPSIFYDLQKFHPNAWQMWLHHKNSFLLNQTIEHIQQGKQENLFRADVDVEIMGRLRMAEVELGFNNDLYPSGQFDLQKVQIALLEHFILGLATLKGHKLINKYKQITEED